MHFNSIYAYTGHMIKAVMLLLMMLVGKWKFVQFSLFFLYLSDFQVPIHKLFIDFGKNRYNNYFLVHPDSNSTKNFLLINLLQLINIMVSSKAVTD